MCIFIHIFTLPSVDGSWGGKDVQDPNHFATAHYRIAGNFEDNKFHCFVDFTPSTKIMFSKFFPEQEAFI